MLKERAADVDYLVAAIATIAEGGSVIGDEVVDSLVRGQLRQPARRWHRCHRASARSSTRSLPARTTPRSASALFISEHAVQKHINSIFSKLGLVEDGETHRRVRGPALPVDLNPSAGGNL